MKKFTKFQMLLFQPGEPAPTHGKAMPERSFAASTKLVTLLNVSKTSSSFWRASWLKRIVVPSGGDVEESSLGELLGVVVI